MFTRKNPLSSKSPKVRSENSSGNGNFVGSRSNGVRSNGVNSKLLNRYAEFNPKKKAANAAAAAKGIVINPTLLHAFLRVYQKEINKLEEDIKKLENDLATPKSANRNSQEDLMWGFLALKTEDQLNDYKNLKAEVEEKLDAIKKLIQKGGGVYKLTHNDYNVHIFFMEYDENLPKYYNKNHSFLWGRMDKKLLNDTKLFEKIEIAWFSIEDMKKRRSEFRNFYQEIVDLFRLVTRSKHLGKTTEQLYLLQTILIHLDVGIPN
jgi:hypothetical protein